MITAEGDTQRDMLFVDEGIQMSYYNRDGAMYIIAFTYPPSISGVPDSFYKQTPSKYTLQALTDTRVKAISYNELNALFDEHREIERLYRKMTEIILSGLITRYTELQSCSIEERFKSFTTRSPHLLQMVPHKYIANYLGINPTNFSKLYNSIKI